MLTLQNNLAKRSVSSQSVLDNVVKCWVVIALFGQWLFAIYIFTLYALPSLVSQPQVTHEMLPGQGITHKNTFDGFVFFTHIVPAALMALSGLLQLLPQIRNKYPKFHRYNGRLFFILGVSGALTGLYLTWVTGLRFSDLGSLGVTVNGLLIPVAIFFAWRTAVKNNFKLHQRFAVHSFLLVNGVWSFRLYLMAWFVVNQGPLGNSSKIDGPADIALSFACYLLPMLIAELVFWAKRQHSERIKWGVVCVSAFGVLITLIGVAAATMMMWLPRIKDVIVALF